MKKIYCIIFVLFALTSCELERVNPNDENAPDEIKKTNIKILDYSIVQEEVADNKIGRNETVYLKVRVKNYGGLYADDVDAVFSENAAGNGMQHMLCFVELEGVSCIRTTLKTGNHIVMRCKHVNNFSFPFVTPLKA